jgi:hypothetical protein
MAERVERLIDSLIAELDHAPKTSPEWLQRAIYFLNKAQTQLAKDAPFLFHEKEFRFAVDPDVKPTDATDTLETTADPWVFKRALADADPLIVAWEDNRKWTGRTLVVKDPVEQDSTSAFGVRHEFTIREVWVNTGYTYVSVDKPWPNAASLLLEWEVFTKDFVLPQEITQVSRIKLYDHPYPNLTALPAERAEEVFNLRYGDQRAAEGPPAYFFRAPFQGLRGPAYTPTVSLTNAQSDPWAGPEPPGTFQYAVSYVFGQQEVWMHLGSPRVQNVNTISEGRYAPWLESPMSRASNAIDQATPGGQVVVTLPDLDFMEAFHQKGIATTLRWQRSGWKKRIYRRRLASVPTGSDPILDFDERFYLMDEVDGHTESWTDDGAVTPAWDAPEPHIGGKQSIRFYPIPDRRYEGALTAKVRLPKLVSLTQVPEVPYDALEVLLALTRAYLYETRGNFAAKRDAFIDYRKGLAVLKKRMGTQIPASQTVALDTPSLNPASSRYKFSDLLVGDMFRS